MYSLPPSFLPPFPPGGEREEIVKMNERLRRVPHTPLFPCRLFLLFLPLFFFPLLPSFSPYKEIKKGQEEGSESDVQLNGRRNADRCELAGSIVRLPPFLFSFSFFFFLFSIW